MRQYRQFKERYPDCILFFRMGDFYELFHDDAITAHKALGITLTQRTEGVPMAGVPYHAVDGYLRRMIEHGFKVAICDQVQDPKDAKGVVARAVTRVLTPGTLIDESLLDSDASNHLAAVVFLDAEGVTDPRAAVGAVELSTGAFEIAVVPIASATDWLARHAVRELLVCATADGEATDRARAMGQALGVGLTVRPAWHFRVDESLEVLCQHYSVAGPEGFGLEREDPALIAAGVLLRYLRETQAMGAEDLAALGINESSSADLKRLAEKSLAHVRPPKRDAGRGHMVIDAVSLRALEIERTVRGGGVEGSLVSVFATRGDGCDTPMGRRLLREWLCQPLRDRGAIEARQSCVAALVSDDRLGSVLRGALGAVQDVPRMIARVSLGRASPRDLVGVGKSVGKVAAIAEAVRGTPAFAGHAEAMESLRAALEPVAVLIEASCVDEPPAHLREGGLIRDGVDGELDEARSLERDSQAWLAEYQAELVREHDLPSLKVGYNRVFGYYIELPAAQSKRAPAVFTRKQTLKNAERYITPELKAFEEKVLSAGDRAIAREQQMFTELCRLVAGVTEPALRFAAIVGELDVLGCFARRAVRRGWVRPSVVDEAALSVKEGRHPVLEELLGDRFVPNDVALGVGESARLALITGPNMSGKSTYIRQVALITLLAHVGSFVPAEAATVGMTDRIFTRIGADDALHAGQSTFMVEMIETANILHHATGRSLVVLDEIGRGTSTLDGLSLAWAIVEKLAEVDGPRVLFATHYHELTTLAERMAGRVQNLHVQVREWGDEIVFMHRILAGAASRSYGIQVAKLAGLPRGVVTRANELLESLSVSEGELAERAKATPAAGDVGAADATGHAGGHGGGGQMALFTQFVPHPVIEEIKALSLERMSPMDAFDALRAIRRTVDGGGRGA